MTQIVATSTQGANRRPSHPAVGATGGSTNSLGKAVNEIGFIAEDAHSEDESYGD